MIFHKKLKEYRRSRGLTQEQISIILGIKRSTYAKYETGENQPDYEMLTKLADFFNVSADELLGRDPNELKEKTIDSLQEINNFVHELGIESIGFFNIENWKNLSREDLEDIKKLFEWITHKAKERKKNNEES